MYHSDDGPSGTSGVPSSHHLLIGNFDGPTRDDGLRHDRRALEHHLLLLNLDYFHKARLVGLQLLGSRQAPVTRSLDPRLLRSASGRAS